MLGQPSRQGSVVGELSWTAADPVPVRKQREKRGTGIRVHPSNLCLQWPNSRGPNLLIGSQLPWPRDLGFL